MTKASNTAARAADDEAMSIRIGREAPPPPPIPTPSSAPLDAGAPGAIRAPNEAREPGEAGSFARVLEAIGREATRGEAAVRDVVRASSGGRDLTSAELLALQTSVYRYSETIDLAAKLVDRAASAAKTVLSGQ